MSQLRSELQQIASEFVAAVLTAMASAPLSDLANQEERPRQPRTLAPTTARRRATQPLAQPPSNPVTHVAAVGKRHRASADEVRRHKQLALATAKQMPPGFSKAALMKRAGSKIDLGRPLSLHVDEGLLTKKGDRRSTRYWVK